MKRWLVVLLAVAALGSGTAFFFRKKPAAPQPQPLTLLFTCDVRGRLVPCGCFTGQLGGLTRIATLFGKRFAITLEQYETPRVLFTEESDLGRRQLRPLATADKALNFHHIGVLSAIKLLLANQTIAFAFSNQ